MSRLPGRLGTLTARDVMTHDLIVLTDTDPLTEAIGKLKENRITGAPVVEESGTFIGILSISDLVEQSSAADAASEKLEPIAHGENAVTWDLYDKSSPQQSEEEKVRDRMSARVTSVTAAAPLVEVARVMCDGHWHRVPVVDEKNALVGIVSTMDVLAALVQSADEV